MVSWYEKKNAGWSRRNNLKAIEIKDLAEEYEKILDYARHLLDENRIAGSISSETMLVLEALCHRISGQKDARTKVKIRGRKTTSLISITMGYEGEMFNPAANDPEETASDDRILTVYADKIEYRYPEKYNIIRITVRRNHMSFILPCFIGIAAATAAFIPIWLYTDASQKHDLLSTYVFPFERMYANAIMMAGTPVVFFSLLRNLTNTFIVSERELGMGKLQIVTMLSSVCAVLLATGTAFLGMWIWGRLLIREGI